MWLVPVPYRSGAESMMLILQELEQAVARLKESESQLIQNLEDCETDLVQVRESRALLQVSCLGLQCV